jgi:Tol biopolymer transport system component
MGNAQPVDVSLQPAAYQHVAVAPDGRRLATTIAGAGPPQLWVKELPDGPFTRLTADTLPVIRPVWSLDGRSIAYIVQGQDTAYARVIPADGSSQGESQTLLDQRQRVMEVWFTPDDDALLFRHGDNALGGADVALFDRSTGAVDEILRSGFNEINPSLSPDGRWLVYTSNSSGGYEVFVRPFRGAGRQVQVSSNGGVSPAWAHNGREIFFVDGDDWMSVATYSAGGTFEVERREQLFELGSLYTRDPAWRGFDLSLDDQRLVMIGVQQADAKDARDGLVLIQNYFEELRTRLPR